jgi:hypothetical protein
MGLPDKPTKHITRPQDPIGTVKNGKIKVFDGDSGKVAWRQGRSGMSKDFDGDPTAANHNRSGLKPQPKHSPRMGKRPKHRAHMGSREKAYSGDE